MSYDKKTLVIILNHNTPEITDKLYESLKPHEKNDYDLMMMDNGSDVEKVSKYATKILPKNVFFGGGLNHGFKEVLKNEDMYDSLLFMNSDLIVGGQNYVKDLRKALFSGNYGIVSPSLISDWGGQVVLDMHKHMRQWGSTTVRKVKYVDFESPMFSIEFIKVVRMFSSDLIYGIGQDHLSGMMCKDLGMDIGVVDWVTAYHMWAYTIRSGNSKLNLDTYSMVSNQALEDYCFKHGIMDALEDSFKWGENYSYD